MTLALTEEQRLIRDSATQLVRASGGITRLRGLRERPPGERFSRELWAEMAELGWLGLPFADEHGGAGLGLADLAVVLEELGRSLAPEPVGPTLLLFGGALQAAGSGEQRARYLPAIARGELVGTVAWLEGPRRRDAETDATVAEVANGGYVLRGAKRAVLAGADADAIVVSATYYGERRLFIVEGGAPGLRRTALDRVDSHPCADIALDGVHVPEAGLLPGRDALGGVLDRATIGLCAEMLGGMSAAFEMTLAWLKERRQFGVPIGSFQALQHRAARAYMELELSRSTVMAAARTADLPAVNGRTLAQAASLAKARCSDAFALITDEGVQMHGGIGMTDEHDIGLTMKRARVAAATYGDAAWHRDRWARLAGY